MSLNGALHVGRSALAASQSALQVAGNNMANAATEGFHRRSVHLSPIRGDVIGRNQFVGRGVQLVSIHREIDTALQSRYRDAVSDERANLIDQRFLTAIETLQNELSENDISTMLSEFFNSFSEVANSPSDNAVRAVAIQQGTSLANRISDLRADYRETLDQVDRQLATAVDSVNGLLDQIADINGQIAQSEPGVGEASALRDQRDLLIDQLSEYMDVTVIEQESGSADILVSSVPVVLAGVSRGVELRTESVDGGLEVSIRVAADGTDLDVDSGTIGGLMRQRENTVQPVIDALEEFTGQLIFQVNRLHSRGQGQQGFDSVTGTYAVNDTTANLNSGDANLPFRIENGSFFIHLTHSDSGQRTSYQIDIDGDSMSLDDLIAEMNTVVGVPNVTAGVNAEGAFTLAADAGYEISFSDDTSGALAALGVNTFFTGRTANTIAVNQVLLDDSTMLAVGAGHVPGSNDTALAIADLQDVALDDLGGVSLREYWLDSVNSLAVRTATANEAVESSELVRESLYSQIQAVSGVSLDEESINLLTFQRQFQAAARFISVIDETLQILLSLA
ncbi:MAG: flagellar hook-associated protein FlgK [Planctomycetota bacterium]|nr:flagellar hook-associated protein FlgK [Planctomycetota bacterium]